MPNLILEIYNKYNRKDNIFYNGDNTKIRSKTVSITNVLIPRTIQFTFYMYLFFQHTIDIVLFY